MTLNGHVSNFSGTDRKVMKDEMANIHKRLIKKKKCHFDKAQTHDNSNKQHVIIVIIVIKQHDNNS